MDIPEMHLYFRELAQQAGMQTVRAILPEDIDININVAIRDIVKRIVKENTKAIDGNTKVARDNSKISQLNSLRSLYRQGNITGNGEGSQTNPYSCEINAENVLLFTGFKTIDDGHLYDARIIEIEELGMTLNDFCNRAEYDAPLCTVVGDYHSITVDFYTGPVQGRAPQGIRYYYIAEPATVCHPDVGAQVDCDLIDYLHEDVVKLAVDYYLKAIANTNITRS